jgi:hypothetical protein
VKDKDSKILRKRKKKPAKRLKRMHWSQQRQPMFSASNISYEMAEPISAIPCGGTCRHENAAMHVRARRDEQKQACFGCR